MTHNIDCWLEKKIQHYYNKKKKKINHFTSQKATVFCQRTTCMADAAGICGNTVNQVVKQLQTQLIKGPVADSEATSGEIPQVRAK